MSGSYDTGLVVVSVLVAIFASYTALDLARSVARTRRLGWLAAGALSMGVGIWSMHFIGMLAFSLPGVPIAYDFALLVLSVIVAIAASAVALFLVSHMHASAAVIGGGGLVMGAAICGMHYIGMASMRMQATITWNRSLVIASILIAIVASFVALHLAFGMREDAGRRVRHLAGGIVMGFAISGMHYTAMAAAQMTPSAGNLALQSSDLLATDALALAVTGAAVLILATAILASVVTRELARRAAVAEEHGRLYRAAQSEIAERKAVEQIVREQAAAMEAAIDGMAIIDENEVYSYVNTAYARLYRYGDPSELLGKHWTIVYGQERHSQLQREALPALREAGSWRGEAYGCRLDGTTFPQEVALTAMPHHHGFICVTRDITERHKAAQALEAQRSFLRTVLDASPSLVYAKDAQGRYTLANEPLARLYGSSTEELLGKTDAAMHPNEVEATAYRSDDLSVLRSGQPVSCEEPLTDPATGETHWFHTQKVPLDIPGHERQVLGISTDITERKRMEAALRHSEEQLRQSQKMEAVGQLAGGIAHDFNNLLTVIQGNLQLAQQDSCTGPDLEAQLEEVQEATRRAADLTRQLLTFSRQELARPELIDPNEVVLQMDRIFRRLIPEDVVLENDLAQDMGTVRIDVAQLQQILLNLVVNARDAITAGGRIRIETRRITVGESNGPPQSTLSAGSYVRIAVEDTGTGMDAQIMERIFEPFYTTKAPGRGTGLGLSTVYGIVTASGGDVTVRSDPAQGSRFEVFLPAVDEAAHQAEPEPPLRPPAPSRTASILVAEDEDQLRSLVARILRRLGYTVLEAESGERALEVAGEHTGPIDLLLTDVIMAGMSGRQLAEHLRVARPGVKLLFMSGYTRDEVLRRGIESASVAFLEKPFTPSELDGAIREVLSAPDPETSE